MFADLDALFNVIRDFLFSLLFFFIVDQSSLNEFFVGGKGLFYMTTSHLENSHC